MCLTLTFAARARKMGDAYAAAFFIHFAFLMLCHTAVWAQVDISTGSAVYTVPVFSYQDQQSGLSHQVAINYNSGQGIKTNQVASNLGLGWGLAGGGEVFRIKHGLPDDQYNPEPDVIGMTDAVASDNLYEDRGQKTLMDKYYPNGFLYKRYDIDMLPRILAFQPRFGQGHTAVMKRAPKAEEDTEQDVFAVNAGGLSKTFVIGRNFEVRFTDGSPVKVTILREETNDHTLYNSEHVITKIKGFVITDENGIEYTFNRYELEEVHEMGEAGYYTSMNKRLKPKGQFVINRWVLTAIKEPVTQRSITFTYAVQHWEYISDLIDNKVLNVDQNVSSSLWRGTITRLYANASVYVLVPAAIQFPDNRELRYNYGQERSDIKGAHVLGEIEVWSGGVLIKHVELETGYFHAKEIMDLSVAPLQGIFSTYAYPGILDVYAYRLALRGVHVFNRGGQEEEKHMFEYYTGAESTNPLVGVPPRMDLHRDFSGLYNLSMNRDAWLMGTQGGSYTLTHTDDTEEAKCGLLKKASTPAGGSVLFEYATRAATDWPQNVVLVKKISSIDFDGSVARVKGYGYPNYDYWLANTVYNTYNLGNARGYYATTGRGYKVHFKQNSSRSIAARLLFPVSSASPIASIITRGLAVEIGAALNALLGPGGEVLGFFISNLLSDFINSLFGPDQTEGSIVASSLNLPVMNNPLPVLMSNITEYDVVGANVYPVIKSNFYSTVDALKVPGAVHAVGQYSFPWSSRQRVLPELLGKLYTTEYLDREGRAVFTRTNNYTYTGETLDDNFRSVKYEASEYYSDAFEASPALNNISDGYIFKEPYNYKTGHSFLTNIAETYLNAADGAVQSVTGTDYTYYNENLLPATMEKKSSDGSTTGANYYYALHFWDRYPANTGLQLLKAAHVPNRQVAVVSWGTRKGATGYLVNGVTLKEYGTSSTQPVTEKRFILNTPVAVTKEQLTAFDAFALPVWLNNVPFDVVYSSVFSNNQLIESWVNNNTGCTSYKYDGKSGMACAVIVNAAAGEVSYTSFESSDKDGWQYDDGQVMNTATSTMGTNCYWLQAGGNIVRTGLNTGRTYRLTAWCTTGTTLLVNGSAGTQLYAGGGQVLVQFMISGQSQVSLSGSGYVDELRLLPADARMKTRHFDQYTRVKTSECSEDNRIAYYEYDGWQRIVMVRDENRDIVKRYCYTVAGQPGDCEELPVNIESRCAHVYAKIFKENISYVNNLTYADIVVRFFADEACTQPCLARNITVSWTSLNECNYNFIGLPRSLKVNGWYATLGTRALVSTLRNPPGCAPGTVCPLESCEVVYVLEEGEGYTPVRTLYSSEPYSQVFTKTGCAAGTIAPTFSYSVEAGKYTSWYTQKHANGKAKDDLNVNGQKGANALTCIPIVYARITQENSSYSSFNESTTVDVVMRFYSDAAYTQPVSVSNLTVSYKSYNTCGPVTTTKTAVANGTSVTLERSAVSYKRILPCTGNCPIYCSVSFTLLAGVGYQAGN